MDIRSEAIKLYLDDLCYQMVAESGNPSDRYHLGKVIMRRFREDPDFLLQIDGATGERDTFGTMLVKSIRCAESFRKLGIKRDDVIVLMAPNSIDLTAPLYAAFYLGISVACIDMNLLKGELNCMFNDIKPKFVFCLASKATDVQDVLTSLKIDGTIVTHGKEENFNTFPEFVDQYCPSTNVDHFQVEEFDPAETMALLISTSGTTGLPKVAILTHKNLFIGLSNLWTMIKEFPVTDLFPVIISPVQWLSAHIHFICSPILKYPRLQTSMPLTADHVYELINKYRREGMGPTTYISFEHYDNFSNWTTDAKDKHSYITKLHSYQLITFFEVVKNVDFVYFLKYYQAVFPFLFPSMVKPTYMLSSPTFMVKLLTPGEREKCDFSSLKWILLGGSAVFQELMDMIKNHISNAAIYKGYGISEASGCCFELVGVYRNSCGKPFGILQYRLVDMDTKKDILEPNVPGELWLKGPTIFKGYYNKPKETQEALTKDGWLKTGDIFYRDEQFNFYFIDRLKLLLKYRNHQVSPTEIETVISGHPGVLDVAVTGIPDLECGDLPVACIKLVKGAHVTAQEIKDLVKNNLTDTKQLRGGVLFVEEFPTTPTGKINRGQLKKMVAECKNSLL